MAQEPARMSLAGESAAEIRHTVATNPEGYNLRLGLTKWSIAAGVDLEANDNVLLQAADAEFDFIVRPQVTTGLVWPVSEKNSLNFSLGLGYSAYTLHSDFNRLFIVPGSELSLDLYIGDFSVEAHDRLALAKDAYADPTAVGGANYSRLQNTAGVSATCDLNKFLLRLAFDHSTYGEFTGGGGFLTGDSDLMAVSAAYRCGTSSLLGLEAGGGWVRYADGTAPYDTATECNVGTFMEARVSEYVSVKAGAGFNTYRPQCLGVSSEESNFNGLYARLALNHRLNRYVEYNLIGGRSLDFGFYAGTLDLWTANLDLRFHLFQKLGVWAGFGFEHGCQVGPGSETFDRFGPHVGLERSFTAKISGALRYQFYQRASDVAEADYVINLVTLNLSYRL